MASRKPHRKVRYATGGAGAGAALGTLIASTVFHITGGPELYAIQVLFAALVAFAAGYRVPAAATDLPAAAAAAPPPPPAR
jgi:hypothetical protein